MTNPASSNARSTWPFWAAAAIGVLGLGWYFSAGHDGARLASTTATETSETVGLRSPEMSATELKMELYSSVSAVRVALQSMTNPATTRTYLPQLQDAADRLDRVNDRLEQLSPGARRGVTASLAGAGDAGRRRRREADHRLGALIARRAVTGLTDGP
jgi:hypothetical protein